MAAYKGTKILGSEKKAKDAEDKKKKAFTKAANDYDKVAEATSMMRSDPEKSAAIVKAGRKQKEVMDKPATAFAKGGSVRGWGCARKKGK